MSRFKLPLSLFLLFLIGYFGWQKFTSTLPKGPNDSADATSITDGEILGWSTDKRDNAPSPKTNLFTDNFSTNYVLEESGSMRDSKNSHWWLNSGGQLFVGNGIAKTIQGELPALSRWRIAYSISNPTDTDDGTHPQNIFRLVTKSKWKNLTQQVYFKINRDQLSSSPNRNSSNGLFLFNRYLDGKNIYYTGIRVDGGVVIKKKINGSYYTMALQNYFPGSYNRDSSPDLIPKNTWIGMKTQVTTLTNGKVEIKVFLDSQNDGQWTQALTAIDDGKSYGGSTLNIFGYAGIRTDFMDVEFRDYQIAESPSTN